VNPNKSISLLLGAGASANAVDNSGFSILMMACGRNNEQIFEQLIRAGADIRAREVRPAPPRSTRLPGATSTK
jgi:ankyrin repeat protein